MSIEGVHRFEMLPRSDCSTQGSEQDKGRFEGVRWALSNRWTCCPGRTAAHASVEQQGRCEGQLDEHCGTVCWALGDDPRLGWRETAPSTLTKTGRRRNGAAGMPPAAWQKVQHLKAECSAPRSSRYSGAPGTAPACPPSAPGCRRTP